MGTLEKRDRAILKITRIMMTNSNFELALQFLSELDQGRQDFTGIDLRGAVLERLTLKKGCIFKGANFQGCRLKFSIMNGCNLNSVIFDEADLVRVVFSGSHLKHASFLLAKLSNSNFMKCRLLNADFRKADLSGANLAQSDLRGVDFRGANLSKTELRGAFYDANTTFDPDIVPASLNMRFAKTKQDSAEAEAKASAPQITYRGAAVAPSSPSQPMKKTKKPLLKFRGAVLKDPDVNETPSHESESSAKPAQKMVRTYRGVPIAD